MAELDSQNIRWMFGFVVEDLMGFLFGECRIADVVGESDVPAVNCGNMDELPATYFAIYHVSQFRR